MLTVVLAIAGIAAVAGVVTLARGWRLRQIALRRLYDDDPEAAEGSSAADDALAGWLARAGYRRPDARALFVSATVGFVGAGAALSQFYRVFLFQSMLASIENVPGSAGDVLGLMLRGGPWILFVVAGLGPTIFIRAARRARVRAMEEDLPLALELFATMAEAGLGFDAALARIVRAQGSDRALTSEFVNFQHDMLAGMSRTQALRQLARRADIPSLTSFTSALVQAEQVGASMAETLQYQAVDLRQRRREHALLQAQALPVKLVFPLVVCFLPGIFVSTLAPVLYQMIQVGDSVLRSSGR